MIRLPRFAAVALVLLFSGLFLSGCGFHLRNAVQLPPDLGPVRVVSNNPYSPLAESLARGLERAGAVPATAETKDAATLQIITEAWGDTPLSVDAQGRSQEQTLRHAVVFELRRADGSVVVPQQTIELSRDYISVASLALGTGGEREILAAELQREMVAAILRRIDAASLAKLPAAHIASPPPSP